MVHGQIAKKSLGRCPTGLGKRNPLAYTLDMQTVVELPEFIRRTHGLLSASEIQLLVNYLAEFPQAGDLMQGTGGVRKLRWAREGKGKSGGVRVIYYFHSELIPLYLLTLFAKNERANLSMAERNELAQLVKQLIEVSRRRK